MQQQQQQQQQTIDREQYAPNLQSQGITPLQPPHHPSMIQYQGGSQQQQPLYQQHPMQFQQQQQQQEQMQDQYNDDTQENVIGSHRRANHNATERLRRENLNHRFNDLASVIPALAEIRKPSKASIIDKALEFILFQQRRADRRNSTISDLVRENMDMKRELNAYRVKDHLPVLPMDAMSAEDYMRDDEEDYVQVHHPASVQNSSMMYQSPHPTPARQLSSNHSQDNGAFSPTIHSHKAPQTAMYQHTPTMFATQHVSSPTLNSPVMRLPDHTSLSIHPYSTNNLQYQPIHRTSSPSAYQYGKPSKVPRTEYAQSSPLQDPVISDERHDIYVQNTGTGSGDSGDGEVVGSSASYDEPLLDDSALANNEECTE